MKFGSQPNQRWKAKTAAHAPPRNEENLNHVENPELEGDQRQTSTKCKSMRTLVACAAAGSLLTEESHGVLGCAHCTTNKGKLVVDSEAGSEDVASSLKGLLNRAGHKAKGFVCGTAIVGKPLDDHKYISVPLREQCTDGAVVQLAASSAPITPPTFLELFEQRACCGDCGLPLRWM